MSLQKNTKYKKNFFFEICGTIYNFSFSTIPHNTRGIFYNFELNISLYSHRCSFIYHIVENLTLNNDIYTP